MGAQIDANRPLFVRLLGGLAVTRGGQSVPLPASRKTRALLAYLVVTGTPQPRQRLCELLWDGPDDPRAALRWSLTKLRPVVQRPDGAPRLIADRERIAFDAVDVSVDLREATALTTSDVALASTDALRRASVLLRGDLLEGLDLPDCYRFHEWCTAERERVRALRVSTLGALVERLSDTPEEALTFAREHVTTDPLSDLAHASVVRLLARLGRRAEALAQVETCRRILERELGGRRSPALEVARLAIGKSSAADEPPPEPPAPAPTPTAPVMAPPAAVRADTAPRVAPALRVVVGRDREREALARFAASVDDQAATDVLVTGEPGIGKSCLLEDLQARIAERGGTVLVGRAFEAESVRPYGIWVDILRAPHLARWLEPHRADLAPLLPELGEAQGDSETKARLFDGVARLLRDLSTGAPVVIVVDDLHWLDEASSGLLHYVARVAQGTRLGIACAAREGELADNPSALRFVRALRREGRLEEIALAPLDAGGIAELVGHGVDATRIHRESGGNPLFAIEVARAEPSSAAGHPPRALDALLEDRLALVEGRARDLLVWASALDRAFDPDLLARVTGDSLGSIASALGDLERHRLLVSHDAATYTFTHELLRKAAYRQISAPRRRLVHLTIARALDALSADANASGDVVHHASLANEAELVARACVTAGDRCLRMHARAQAKDFAARGLAHAARLGRLDGLHLRAELLRIAAYSAAADPPKRQAFEDEAEEVVRIAREAGRAEDEATALFVLSFLSNRRADVESARATTLRQAAAARGADPVASVPSIANTALCLALIECELPKARALLDEATELARTHRLSAIDLDLCEGLLGHFEGDVVVAEHALARAVLAGRASGDTWRESIGLMHGAMLALERGAWEEARVHAGALRAVATRLGDGSEGVTADALEALAIHGAGERAAAPARAPADAVDASIAALELADAKTMLSFALTLAAEIAITSQDLGRARILAARALRAAETVQKPSATILAHVALARARATPAETATHLAAASALVHHPYGISKRARTALARLACDSNAEINGAVHASAVRRRKR